MTKGIASESDSDRVKEQLSAELQQVLKEFVAELFTTETIQTAEIYFNRSP